MSRYLYSARLVPIGKPVCIPFVDGSPSEFQTFTDDSFEVERTSKTKPPIYLNHDEDLEIGRVGVLSREGGWWCADFMLGAHVPDDVEFEVGQNVSVGLQQLKIGSREPLLTDVSIVRRGAVKGAQITRRFALPPKTHDAPAVVVASPKPTTATAEVIPITRAATRRLPNTFPRAELDRRWDFAAELEEAGIDGVFEAELEHMQRLEQAMQLGRLPPPMVSASSWGRSRSGKR